LPLIIIIIIIFYYFFFKKKKEFEMKDLEKTKFCFGLQNEHFPNEILVYLSTYTEKVPKHFYIEKAHHLSTQMVVR
jgi:hypothetical protein